MHSVTRALSFTLLVVSLVLAAAASGQAQEDLSQIFPNQIRNFRAVYDGDTRLTDGTRLIVQQDLDGDVVLKNGQIEAVAPEESPYVSISITKVVIDRHTRRERAEVVPVSRGDELKIVGELRCFRTAFDSGSYVISCSVTTTGGENGVLAIVMPEQFGRFVSAGEFQRAIGGILQFAR